MRSKAEVVLGAARGQGGKISVGFIAWGSIANCRQDKLNLGRIGQPFHSGGAAGLA